MLPPVDGAACVTVALPLREADRRPADARGGPLRLAADELPFLIDVEVVERVRAGAHAW
jgi:hypothetical protein